MTLIITLIYLYTLFVPCGVVGEDIPTNWYISDPFTLIDMPCPDYVPVYVTDIHLPIILRNNDTTVPRDSTMYFPMIAR